MINDTKLARYFISQGMASTSSRMVKRLLKKMAAGLKETSSVRKTKSWKKLVQIIPANTSLPNSLNMLQMSIDDCTDDLSKICAKNCGFRSLSPKPPGFAQVSGSGGNNHRICLLWIHCRRTIFQCRVPNIKPEFDESLSQSTIICKLRREKFKQTLEEVGEDLEHGHRKAVEVGKHQQQHGWCFHSHQN